MRAGMIKMKGAKNLDELRSFLRDLDRRLNIYAQNCLLLALDAMKRST